MKRGRKTRGNVRYFGGKRYIWNFGSYRKSDAESHAKVMRQRGHGARVVKGVDAMGTRKWMVYTTI